MKPTCKSESKWIYWRCENPNIKTYNKFDKYAKNQMIRARRRHSNIIIKEQQNEN